MAVNGKFKFKSNEYRVIEFTHEMHRVLDGRGAPSSQPSPGFIHLTIEATDTNVFAGWAFSGSQSEDGEIILSKRDSEATMRSLKFKDAYVFGYKEHYSANDDSPATISLSITPKEIQLTPDSIDWIADWV